MSVDLGDDPFSPRDNFFFTDIRYEINLGCCMSTNLTGPLVRINRYNEEANLRKSKVKVILKTNREIIEFQVQTVLLLP